MNKILSRDPNVDGIYALGCVGPNGFALVTWVFIANKIYGFDSRSCLYDGSYEFTASFCRCHLQMTIPPGISTPMDTEPAQRERKIDFELTLSENWASGRPILIHLP